jgi:hypothetical protein
MRRTESAGHEEIAMSTAMRGNDETGMLGVGVRVAAVAAMVGLVTLAAVRGHVLTDELAAEQPIAVAAAPASAIARIDAAEALATGAQARDPSLPDEAAVVPRAKDESAAPTF